jgi:flagellar hook-associated protein 2
LSISFGSINTGLPKDIVQQLVAAEKIPIKQIEARKEKVENRKALVSELIKLVEDVRGEVQKNTNIRDFREIKSITNEDIIGVTLDKNIALPGSYQIEVERLAQKSSAMTNGVSNKDETYLGVGFIQYTLPNGETKDLYINSDESSLTGIAKTINQNPDLGVRASVINDGKGGDEPWHLVLSLIDTGDDNRVEFPYLYFVDGEEDLFLEMERKAHDALIKMDGFPIELPTNKADSVIPGATIDLKKAKPGEEFTLTIQEDLEAISTKAVSLIDKINAVLKFVKDQNTIDESTDTSKTLGGDIVLQSLESRIRSAIFQDFPTSSGFMRIGDVGVSFQRDGLLQLDEKKFTDIVNKNFKGVSEFFTGYVDQDGKRNFGFMNRFLEKMNETLRFPDGLLQSKKRGLDSRVEDFKRRIEQKEKMVSKKEEMLKQKFSRLETTINQIKSQGAGIAALSAGNQASPVTQLG